MEKSIRRSLKPAIQELEDGLLKLSNSSYSNIDKLMRDIMKKYDLSAKELHYGFRDKHHDQTPDEWIKGQRKMKTFKEFYKYSSNICQTLIEKTWSSREAAVKGCKADPPFGGEPYRIKQKARKGRPPEWRAVRATTRAAQEKKRRQNLRGLTYNDFYEFAKRNLYPNPAQFARKAQRIESSKKSSQTREAKKLTQQTGIQHSIDHSVPQQTKRSPETRERFQRISPGDVSSNRQILPLSSNIQKGSRLPKRGEPGYGITRSGAIRTAVRAALQQNR